MDELGNEQQQQQQNQINENTIRSRNKDFF